MRLCRFSVSGYKNIRQRVELDGLGPVNLIHGVNNVGKSNLLQAMALFFRCVSPEGSDLPGGIRSRSISQNDSFVSNPGEWLVKKSWSTPPDPCGSSMSLPSASRSRFCRSQRRSGSCPYRIPGARRTPSRDTTGPSGPGLPERAPQAYVTSQGVVKLPPHVIERLGVGGGGGVVFADAEPHGVRVISNDDYLDELGLDEPTETDAAS